MPARGFTLVELLVVVAIIGVLSTIGVTVFTGARNSAQQAKIKADLDAIRKAYEAKYDPTTGSYGSLTESDFSDGKIPTRPDGSSYITSAIKGPQSTTNTTNQAFAVCASTGTNAGSVCYTPSSTCSCVTSNQGQAAFAQSGSGGVSSCDAFGLLNTNLVAYYKMNDASWSGVGSVKDERNTYNGTPQGGITNVSVAAPHLAANFVKEGYFNNPVNNGLWVNTNLQASVGPFAASNSFSLSAWIKTTDVGSINTVYGIIDNGFQDNGSFILGYRPTGSPASGKVFFQVRDPGCLGNCPTLYGNTTVSDGNYHLVVATRDGSTSPKKVAIFVDGQSEINSNDSTTGSLYNGGRTLGIGRKGLGGGDRYFNGYIDDVRIYNKALTQSDIDLLYNSSTGCVSP